MVEETLSKPLELDGLYIGTPKSELRRAAQLIGPHGAARSGLEFGQALRGPVCWIERMLNLVGLEVEFASALDMMPRGISAIDFSSEKVLRSSIPSINGLFTARSLARVYAMMAGGGQLGGQRLISKKIYRRATEIQHPTKGRAWLPLDLNWRLGYHRIGTMSGLLPEAYGHFGFGGSGAWADPSRELSVAMIVNTGSAILDSRILRIGAAAVKAADARA